MKVENHFAHHLRQVYFGGNWTASNLKDQLADVTWQEARTKVYDINTIATLFNHMTYYVTAVLKVMEGGALDAKDKFSFAHPPIDGPEDWTRIQAKAWEEVERFAKLIEALPAEKLWEDFTDKKYGNYARNIQGIIEHLHYHLGQIVLVKKILRSKV